MKLLTLATLAVSLAAAGHPGWSVVSSQGVTVRYPPAWYATKRPLTNVTSPSQPLAIASYRFPARTRPNGCRPDGTLEEMPPAGALVVAIDLGTWVSRPAAFSPKPKRPRLVDFANYECMGPSYQLRFRDSGRFFLVHVALGPRAGRDVRATVLHILASFEARPR